MKQTRELADVLHDTFSNTDLDELDSYTDAKIAQYIRAKVGSSELKEYDALSREQWVDAWSMFGQMKKGNLRRGN